MSDKTLWGDTGQFLEDLFGAEPSFEDYQNGYSYNNWTDGFIDRAIENANKQLDEIKNSDIGQFVGDTLGQVSGQTELKNNAILQSMANAFSDYSRLEAQKYNAEEAKKAYDRQWALNQEVQRFNSKEAEIARMYNTQMSNTAYQRAVADMREAGLNPYLAYAQGGAPVSSVQSASVGVGNSPTASITPISGKGANVGNTAAAVTNLVTSVLSTALGFYKATKIFG